MFKFGVDTVVENWLMKRIERLFHRCSRVERLEMGLESTACSKALLVQLELIGKVMRGKNVDELVLFIYNDDASPEEHLVGVRYIQQFKIKIFTTI